MRACTTLPLDLAAIDRAGFCFRIEGNDAVFRREEWSSEARVQTDGATLTFVTEGCSRSAEILSALRANV